MTESSDPINGFALGLATNLAYDLLIKGSNYLVGLGLGTKEQQAVRAVFQDAFVGMLAEILPDDEALHVHTEELLRDFVAVDRVAEWLLDLALKEADPPLDKLRQAFDATGFDSQTVPFDFDHALLALVTGLRTALTSDARHADSQLINRFMVGRLDECIKLLRQLIAGQSQNPVVKPTASVFLSYARKDAEALARRLHQDLHAQNIDAWLDKLDLPSGNTFIDEIDKAIQRADYFVLVFTPGAIQSDFCRDEWAKALEHYKPIIPVLHLGDYSNLPREANIYLNDALDFRTEGNYQTAFDKLLVHLRTRPTQAGKTHGVIQLPRQYLSRPGVIDDLVNQITTHKTEVLVQPEKRIGLHGMGGLGKSITVAALTNEYVIRRSFPDGIFWLTIGSAPDMKEQWGRLRQWLDGSTASFENETAATDFFEQMTQDKECLLILDDVWYSDHVTAFLKLGRKSRLLVTTRNATVLDESSIKPVLLDLLKDDEARQLLALTAETDMNTLPPSASMIIEKCGNLPLGLAMIGAMVRGRPAAYWDDARDALEEADLEAIAARFPEYRYPNLFAALEVSIKALDSDLQERYFDFAIFPDDVLIPEEVPVTFWNPDTARTVRRNLDDLVQRNLLKREANNTLSIHDLQLAYIRKRASDLGNRHKRLLKNYNEANLPWHKVSNDGYLYDYLAYHLKQAGRIDELRALFASQDWMRVRVAADDWRYDGYIRDMETCWKLVEQNDPGDPDSLGQLVRFALICTSINSLSSNYVPELVVRAVELGLWTVERALSVAYRVSAAEQRFATLIGVVSQDAAFETKADLRRTGLAEALGTARAIEDEGHRAEALSDLAPHLPPDLRHSVLAEALGAARAIRHEGIRAATLNALAPHLSPDLRHSVLAEALGAARAIGDEWPRAGALVALAPHLPPDLRHSVLAEALEATRAIEDEGNRAWALSDLAPHLSPDLLTEALGAARAIGDEGQRVTALCKLAPHLPPDLQSTVLAEALLATRAIRDEAARAIGLSTLAPHLSPDLRHSVLAEALLAARAIGHEKHRARALRALAPHLLPDLRHSVLAEALEAARAIGHEEHRAHALSALAPHLPPDLLAEAMLAARAIGDERARAVALIGLAPDLPPGLLAEALGAARAIRYERARAVALAALVPHLSPDLLTEALEAARAIRDEGQRVTALRELAPLLPPEMLPDALGSARAIGDEQRCAWALIALAPYLPPDLLAEAMLAARAIGDEQRCAWALIALAPHLPPEMQGAVLADAAEAARAIGINEIRAKTLRYLPPHLPPDQRHTVLAEALGAARAIGDERARAWALSDLAPHLPPDLLAEALGAARAIGDDKHRAYALSAFAPHLPSDLLVEALGAARAIEATWERAKALRNLAPHLSPDLLAEAMGAARVIRDDGQRVAALRDLAPHLPPDLLAEALGAARAISSDSFRAESLRDLALHLPPDLRHTVLAEALLAARAIEEADWRRAEALSALAPHLPPDLRHTVLAEALLAARAIEEADWRRAEALRNLAPHLPEALVQDALKAVANITDEAALVRALSAFLPRLDRKQAKTASIQIRQAVGRLLWRLRNRNREDVLRLFSDEHFVSPTVFGETYPALVAGHIAEICNHWEWL